jgi:hypothetical protein
MTSFQLIAQIARSSAGRKARRLWTLVLLTTLIWVSALAQGQDLDREPINYSNAPADNSISRLQQRLDKGGTTFSHDEQFGYLRSLLRELHVPESSQMLVFSKTSFQRDRITPRTPRALYFNDDTYVGFCQHGAVLEISAADPQLGAVFYSLDQEPVEKPRFVRQGDSCLICHGSSQNQGFPGHLLRSVYVEGNGLPLLASATYRIDQTSPLEHRWGGWYVTGTTGQQKHLGNLIVPDRSQQPERIDNTAGINVTDLSSRVQTSPYLTGSSDVVALMVLEHQTEMHNRITRANLLTRMALHEEATLNKELGQPPGTPWDSIARRIKNAGEPLVKYLLFSGEAVLTDRVQGPSGFTEEFVRRGPRDNRGRSLRDFDLGHRLFRYPCSYLIYSAAFDGLPGRVKEYVLQRLWEVLTGKDTSADFAHLSAADRQAIREILLSTKPNLPDYWQPPPPAP